MRASPLPRGNGSKTPAAGSEPSKSEAASRLSVSGDEKTADGALSKTAAKSDFRNREYIILHMLYDTETGISRAKGPPRTYPEDLGA